jgi:hypothetical protein
MRKLYIAIFIAFLFSFLFLSKTNYIEAASTIYADINLSVNCTSGNYSIANRNCTGTDGSAYHRIQDAITTAALGDTVLIRSGIYRDKACCAGSSEVGFILVKSLTLKSYNNESVILTYDPNNLPHDTNGALGSILYIDVTSDIPIVVDGLEIDGYKPLGCVPVPGTTPTICTGQNLELEWNFAIPNATGNVTIRNNKFYNSGSSGMHTTGNRGQLLIENNDVYNGGFTSREHGIYAGGGQETSTVKIIRYNKFHNMSGYGIHVYTDTGNNYEIYGNLIYNNGEGGLLLTGTNHKVYNNSIFNNTGLSGLIFYGSPAPSGDIVKNNVFWGNYSRVFGTAMDIDCGDDGGNNIFSNNDFQYVARPTSGLCANLLSSPHLSVDPKFVNSGAGDFRLQTTSPVINAGINIGTTYQNALDPVSLNWPPSLINQNSYGNWEIGAYAFTNGATTAPTASPLPTQSPLPGDLNNDGKVDGVDYVLALTGHGDLNIVISNMPK